MDDEVAIDEGPWGINPRTNKPYKRDPGPFAHLRGVPFGTKPDAARAMKQEANGGKPPRPRKAKDMTPPAHTSEWYADKIAKGADAVGAGLAVRGENAKEAGMMLRINSADLGKAWGPVAVSHPKLGRVIDKLTTQSEMGMAITTTGMTLAMMARASGIIKDDHPFAKLIDTAVAAKVVAWAQANPEELARMMVAPTMGDGEHANANGGVPFAPAG